jgi:hypothetical protein
MFDLKNQDAQRKAQADRICDNQWKVSEEQSIDQPEEESGGKNAVHPERNILGSF